MLGYYCCSQNIAENIVVYMYTGPCWVTTAAVKTLLKTLQYRLYWPMLGYYCRSQNIAENIVV